jgi:four helix bundle protein
MAHTFRNIKVWEKAHKLVLQIYMITRNFPVSERYGLTTQLRRSAASVATNIVEGYKRKSDKDFSHFLNMADSSLEETKYHMILARDLKYLSQAEYGYLSDLADEVGRMLYGFQKHIKLTAYSL